MNDKLAAIVSLTIIALAVLAYAYFRPLNPPTATIISNIVSGILGLAVGLTYKTMRTANGEKIKKP